MMFTDTKDILSITFSRIHFSWLKHDFLKNVTIFYQLVKQVNTQTHCIKNWKSFVGMQISTI